MNKSSASLFALSLFLVPVFALADPAQLIQRGLERAVAGEVLLNTAKQCGWVLDDAEFKTAPNASLQSAVAELDVPSRFQVLAKLLGHQPDWMQFARDQAQAQVTKGACTDKATRTAWEALRSTPLPLGNSNRENPEGQAREIPGA